MPGARWPASGHRAARPARGGASGLDEQELFNARQVGEGPFIVPLLQGATWTSGRIQTKSQFAAPTGGEMMVTAAIVQPNPTVGVGFWPGFWLISPGWKWPEGGEIDILETVNAAAAPVTVPCQVSVPVVLVGEPGGLGG